VKQATYVEVETQTVPLAVPTPPTDDAAARAEVRRRVRLLYGGAPATVTLEPQPDGSVLVHVRVHDGGARRSPTTGRTTRRRPSRSCVCWWRRRSKARIGHAPAGASAGSALLRI